MTEAAITIEGSTVGITAGATVLECLVEAGLLLRSDCGGRGTCGKCRVRITDAPSEALSQPDTMETRTFDAKERSMGYRLACRARVLGSVSVEIPDESRLTREIVQKGLPVLLSRFDSFPPQPRPARGHSRGIAVDLGTTTIAVYLCDLGRAAVAASTSVRNPQSIFGDDVLSRLSAIARDRSALPRLHRMAVSALDWAISGLCTEVGVQPEEIRDIVCVGNSIMLHFLLGDDPSSIGVYPYLPSFTRDQSRRADSVGLRSCPGARLRTLPLISGYLGADIIAAAIASDIRRSEPGTLLVDVGTNGEIIAVTAEGFAATSCATGPAFEGAVIRHGMQAASGAIDAVRFIPDSGRFEYSVIQRGTGPPKAPVGICGSGVVSTVAELLRAGVIDAGGSFNPACRLSCLRRGEDGILEVIIAPAEATGTGHAVTFSQMDVRAVQLAKGALRTGIDLLCREYGLLRPRKILLAGAFGSFIGRRDALRIGMFPEMDVGAIEVVGNAAGAGAVLSLLHKRSFEEARAIAGATRVFDLASCQDFQKTFVNALSF